MLIFYPDSDLYVAGTSENGSVSIDKDSEAFLYCEYLRATFGTTEGKELEGDYYVVIMVSEYRVEQIRIFVGLEDSFRYLMWKGL